MTHHRVPAATVHAPQSRLFAPYRTLGHVCSALPVQLKRLGSERFLTVALSHSWQSLNVDRLRVVMACSPHPQRITAIQSFKDITFVAHASTITVYRRNGVIASLTTKQHIDSTIVRLVLLAQSHLLSIDAQQRMCVWDIEKMDLAKRKDPPVFDTTSVKSQSMVDNDSDSEDDSDDSGSEPTAVIGSVNLLSLTLPDDTPLTLPSGTRVTDVIHPPTYLNKILIGYSNGCMVLFNVHSMRVVYEYFPVNVYQQSKALAIQSQSQSLSNTEDRDSDNDTRVGITCIVSAPVAGVIGIGFTNGLILQFDLDHSTVISAFTQSVHGSVTAMAFRDDGVSRLVTGTQAGHVLTWDLGSKDSGTGEWVTRPAYYHCTRHCHSGPIQSLIFLTQEPLLITSSTDNAIHLFNCDNDKKIPVFVKSRSGHHSHPTKIRFYPRDEEVGGGASKTSDHLVLSAGSDHSLRLFSMRRDEESRELGQNKWEKKRNRHKQSKFLSDDGDDDGESQSSLSAITSLSFASQRQERHYANILTSHFNDAAAHAWSTHTGSIANIAVINVKALPMSAAKSTAISACGQWGIIGKSNGHIEIFSMESGRYKGAFGRPAKSLVKPLRRAKNQLWSLQDLMRPEKTDDWHMEENEPAPVLADDSRHRAAVTGLAVDGLNRWLVSVSLDCQLKVWDFAQRTLLYTETLPAPISQNVYHRENDLFAIACDNGLIRIYDANTLTNTTSDGGSGSKVLCIRSFHSHTSPITDMAFHPRGHLLLSSSLNGLLHVHDLRSASLVDVLVFNEPVVSVAWSLTGDCIATAHTGNVGIQLWLNKEWAGLSMMDELANDREFAMDVAVEMDAEEADSIIRQTFDTPATSDSGSASDSDRRFGLIQFSSLPRTRWHTLINIDALRTRNQAKQAELTKNPEAPFFLPSIELSEKTNKKRKLEKEQALNASIGNVAEVKAEMKKERSRIVKSHGMLDEHAIIELLRDCERSVIQHERSLPVNDNCNGSDIDESLAVYKWWQPVTDELTSMSAPEIDALLQSLTLNPETEPQYLLLFLHYFIGVIGTYRQFEFLQSVQCRFLRLHALTLRENRALYDEALKELSRLQRRAWRRVENRLMSNLALVKHLAHIQ